MKESNKLIINETEAIECLKSNKPTSGYVMLQESIDMAIQALEKVQQYRAIGTPEECQAAVEKQTAMKGIREKIKKGYNRGRHHYYCPICYEKGDLRNKYNVGLYCSDCGQKLDWSDGV